jgi:hypothetical protein
MSALSLGLLDPCASPNENASRGSGLQIDDVAGDYVWKPDVAPLLDFECLDLNADGTYVARVEARLLNPNIRTFGTARCMLPEEGRWNIYVVSGQDRLRIRPTTSRSRVYAISLVGGVDTGLALSRRGERTVLLPQGMPSGTIPTCLDCP